MIDKFITIGDPDDFVNNNVTTQLSHMFGRIQLLDELPEMKTMCDLMIKDGKLQSFKLSPYGYGERDDNGNITNFQLLGFSLDLL